VYDPGSNKWSSIAGPTFAQQGVVRVVVNGKPKLLAIGAHRGSNFDPENIEVYTP
jgi:hypothetical protein